MVEKYYHQKLVRDKIPDVIKATGDEGEFRILDDEEYEKELKKKLIEEAKEVSEASNDKLMRELADVLELTKSIAEHYKIPFEEVEKLQKEKRESRGGFVKKLFLIWSTGKAGK